MDTDVRQRKTKQNNKNSAAKPQNEEVVPKKKNTKPNAPLKRDSVSYQMYSYILNFYRNKRI